MTNHIIELKRDRAGKLSAESCIPLGTERRELRIITSKDYRQGVSTDVRVFQQTEDGFGWTHAFGLAGGGDFSKKVGHDHQARATEKKLRDMHTDALRDLDTLLAEAREHYLAGKHV
jgi:hypothetical protein